MAKLGTSKVQTRPLQIQVKLSCLARKMEHSAKASPSANTLLNILGPVNTIAHYNWNADTGASSHMTPH